MWSLLGATKRMTGHGNEHLNSYQTVLPWTFNDAIWDALLQGKDCRILKKDYFLFRCLYKDIQALTHWGRVTHICVGNLTIIGPDNGLSPGRRQAIIWTNAGILLIGPWGTNFSEILTGIDTFSFRKMHLKMSTGKRRPFCLGLNVLTHWTLVTHMWVSGQEHHWFR